ncbi:hypothetical protein [Undibacterium sp. TJN19]|uniref:hypothetical protein n=1 Tax=Undibacterium sp. TJN19 TaxID=3413055 RepID=UPI003BF06969
MTITSIDIISRTAGNINSPGLPFADPVRDNIRAETLKVDDIYWLATFNETRQKRTETLITINVKLRKVKLGVIHGAGKIHAPEKPMPALDLADTTALQFLTRKTWRST